MKKISGLKFIKGIPVDHGKRTSYFLEGPARTREDRIAQVDLEEAESLDLCIPTPEGKATVQHPIEVILKNLIHAQEMNLTATQAALEEVMAQGVQGEPQQSKGDGESLPQEVSGEDNQA